MANTLILKKSTVAAKVPLATDLEIGELAVNTADAKLYTKHSDGSVVTLKANPLAHTHTISDVTGLQTALNLKANAATTVEQSDIGTGPNEISLNQHLGDMAFQSASALVIKPATSATPHQVGSMVFQLTSDTQLVVKVKGSDGTVRSATLTLA